MANYLIQTCDGVTSLIVDPNGNTINIGSKYFFTFTGETLPICGEVISEDSGLINETLNTVTLYSNCLECLESEGFSATLASCNDEFIYPQTLNEFPNLPIVGEYYRFCDSEGGGLCFCFEFVSFTYEPGLPAVYNGGPFLNCDCQQEPPRSANTETLVCAICCDCGATGSTVTQVSPPHPVWTDGYGTQVTQLNMITLGGPNGLNN
jgi:hypothetical protein